MMTKLFRYACRRALEEDLANPAAYPRGPGSHWWWVVCWWLRRKGWIEGAEGGLYSEHTWVLTPWR